MAVVGAAAAGVGALAVKALLFPGMTPSTIAAVVAGGLISGAAIPQKARQDQPLERLIPWTHIKKIGRDQSGKRPKMVTFKVTKGKPKGMVYFIADGDVDLLLADLQTRI